MQNKQAGQESLQEGAGNAFSNRCCKKEREKNVFRWPSAIFLVLDDDISLTVAVLELNISGQNGNGVAVIMSVNHCFPLWFCLDAGVIIILFWTVEISLDVLLLLLFNRFMSSLYDATWSHMLSRRTSWHHTMQRWQVSSIHVCKVALSTCHDRTIMLQLSLAMQWLCLSIFYAIAVSQPSSLT